jgi:hypothetical protein
MEHAGAAKKLEHTFMKAIRIVAKAIWKAASGCIFRLRLIAELRRGNMTFRQFWYFMKPEGMRPKNFRYFS